MFYIYPCSIRRISTKVAGIQTKNCTLYWTVGDTDSNGGTYLKIGYQKPCGTEACFTNTWRKIFVQGSLDKTRLVHSSLRSQWIGQALSSLTKSEKIRFPRGRSSKSSLHLSDTLCSSEHQGYYLDHSLYISVYRLGCSELDPRTKGRVFRFR
jgi:hypothetical protein